MIQDVNTAAEPESWGEFWARYITSRPDMENTDAMNLSGESFKAGMHTMKVVMVRIMDGIATQKDLEICKGRKT